MLNPTFFEKHLSINIANTDKCSGRITKLYCNRYSFEFAG
nr:MAG TPA: hypothetical protein [Caudoviricetes sp.]